MTSTPSILTPEDLARIYADPKPSTIAVQRRRLDEPVMKRLLSEADALGLRIETYE